LSYATVAGIEWCVLTDGDEYRFYNSTAPVDAEEKLFCQIRLSQADEVAAANTLGLISRSNMEGNILDDLWSAHFVDRRVKNAIQDLFKTKDRALIRLIRSRAPRLTPKEIIDSLRRLDFRIESDTPIFALPVHADSEAALPQAAAPRTRTGKPKGRKTGSKQRTKVRYGVTLKDLIAAGLLKPPVKLFRKTLSVLLEATVTANGAVEFEGKSYATCSTAAEYARSKATGRIMHTNGWSFWQLIDSKGKKRTLLDIRREFIESRGSV
jgi:hypothetical protein